MGNLPHILLLIPLILTSIATGLEDERPLVATKYGELLGVTVPVKETSRAVDAFFGVPFAKPPVGSLRFANPEPPEPWKSVRDASKLPPMCLQVEEIMSWMVDYYQSSVQLPRSSEDCLYLNVFTPADRDKKSKLPVMVFIHGGGLLFGFADMFDGSALSAYENVVLVSIQYRLGIPGFFSTGDNRLPGNNGFLDQVAALQWVQENIADFGGDPKSVTIFGESAGGISVSAHVASPLSKGLFHRAISESGTVAMRSLVVSRNEELIHFQNIISKISGCDRASIADCLMKKSEEEIYTITQKMGMLFLPASVDGIFLPKPAMAMFAKKESNKVPYLIGMNNQEFGFASLSLLNLTDVTGGMTKESVAMKLQNLPLLSLSPEAIPHVMDEYLGDTTDPVEIRDRFQDLCGDKMFVIPSLKIAKYHRDMGLPVYLYEYQHPPSLLSHARPHFVKADHGDELIFVTGGPFLRDGVLYSGLTDNRPIVGTKYGQLRGITVPVKDTSRAVDVFFGVPFAKPPVGSLRFAKPEPPEPWKCVRDASKLPPMCLQTEAIMGMLVEYYRSSVQLPHSAEDCLYLNVFTPADRDVTNNNLPVMVFTHGGGLLFGSASLFDGSALSAYENLVVVVIQHRLGVLGFLSTGDNQLPGNYGFMDQIAALQWVQENIADFGGDPKCVTTFGESAGGVSVSALVSSPLAKGLFHRAISESGSAVMPGVMVIRNEDLTNTRNKISMLSGCDLASIRDCLMSKTEEEIHNITQNMGLLIVPASVDGIVLPKPVDMMYANKECNKVPYLMGVNNQELGWLLLILFGITEIEHGMTQESVKAKLQDLRILSLSPEEIPHIMDEYIGDTTDQIEIRKRFQDLCADILFLMPALKIAKLHRDMGLPVYFYEYQHPPSFLADARPDFVGADHMDEVISVSGGLFLRDGVLFSGNGTNEEKILSKTIMKYWANFARTGNPNSPGLTTWPKYDTTEHYLGINLTQKSFSKLKEEKFIFWTKILPQKIRSDPLNDCDHTEL